MKSAQIENCAKILDDATREVREIKRFTATDATLSIDDSYLIQQAGIRLRLARGEKIVGYKMGLTSKAKMKQMGVDSPIYGVLTDRMLVPSGSRYLVSGCIHPRIEPEVAFMLERDLEGKVTPEQALEACG